MSNNEAKTMFEKVFAINVNEYTEKKNGLTYLSWSYAWAEFKKVYPDATYEIKKFENNMPFIYDEKLGYMVFTSVTAGNLTYEMWLPVMDGANKSMKAEPYTYDTKYKKGLVVEAATMFDINKTIMRCLVKNLAMFGLGLYVYSGEDLPEEEKKEVEQEKQKQAEPQTITEGTKKQIQILAGQFAEAKGKKPLDVYNALQEKFNYTDINTLKETDGQAIIKVLINWNRQSQKETTRTK